MTSIIFRILTFISFFSDNISLVVIFTLKGAITFKFPITNGIWILKTILILKNKFEIIRPITLKNYAYSNFWASSAKFTSKYEIESTDVLSFLSATQKLLHRMSWNFVFNYLKLSGVDLCQNNCRLQLKNFEIYNIKMNDIKGSFIWILKLLLWVCLH